MQEMRKKIQYNRKYEEAQKMPERKKLQSRKIRMPRLSAGVQEREENDATPFESTFSLLEISMCDMQQVEIII